MTVATLGAGGWQTFFCATLPNSQWALLYGVMLCHARALGEFGAVSVVSGHLRSMTNTLPLHVEILYTGYNAIAAFSAASLRMLLAIVTLVLKTWIAGRARRQVAAPVMETLTCASDRSGPATGCPSVFAQARRMLPSASFNLRCPAAGSTAVSRQRHETV